MYIGIDNGKDGGIIVVDSQGKIQAKFCTPIMKHQATKTKVREKIDPVALHQLLIDIQKLYDIKHTFVEPALMASNGIMAVASTWYTYGVYEGVLSSLKLPYTKIAVHQWQKFIGLKRKGETKKGSLEFALLNSGWTEKQFFKSTRHKKAHDGFTDAYAIACCGLFTFLNNGK